MSKRAPNNSYNRLARMIQRGFAETETKQDIKTLDSKITATNEDLALLRGDTEAGFREIIHTLKAIQKEIEELKGMDAELTSLRLRLARVERKVGLAR